MGVWAGGCGGLPFAYVLDYFLSRQTNFLEPFHQSDVAMQPMWEKYGILTHLYEVLDCLVLFVPVFSLLN